MCVRQQSVSVSHVSLKATAEVSLMWMLVGSMAGSHGGAVRSSKNVFQGGCMFVSMSRV